MVLAGDELRQPVAPRQPRSCAGAGDLRRLPGHDDVWLPCHLQALVATTEREGLDVATTRCFSIGPPGSNALSLSGAGLRTLSDRPVIVELEQPRVRVGRLESASVADEHVERRSAVQ